MERLRSILSEMNIDISDLQLESFERYYELLISWNKKINLTSIIDKDEVIIKHFADSISLLRYMDIGSLSLLDVGTGGGFPGIPLKIMCPSCKVVLLESLNKRIMFLESVIKELGLEKISTVNGRAEDIAFDKLYRERFDVVVSRAVANLSTLSEYCIPFVKRDGSFISYKGGDIGTELDDAHYAITVLGGSLDRTEKFNIAGTDIERTLVYIRKVKDTEERYPRRAGVPSKKPL